MQTKYVVVLGSLLSGIGKGIVTSSVAKLLSLYNYNAMPLKFDGYLNYDCGTMNPFRHGEVFVLEDGSEVDMDFGTYERFLNKNLNKSFTLTGGKLFSEMIEKERKGDFLGRDVQIIPHMTDLIIEKIERVSAQEELDVLIIEVGGTVGDIENSYFVEAMRQLALRHRVVFIDVTYVPELGTVGEQKTKPTQIALRSLRQEGIQPNFVVCRSENKLDDKARKKIALFSNLPPEHVIDDHDVKDIYAMPVTLMQQDFDKMLIKELGLEKMNINPQQLYEWRKCIDAEKRKKPVSVAVVGKYVELHDSYASVIQALHNAAHKHSADLTINWVESETLEDSSIKGSLDILMKSDGILVPGGFGGRGTEGMIRAIEYARTNKVPYLGLCLGMQLMAIEFARNVCKLDGAGTREFGEAKHNVIDIMEEQKKINNMGGTMRLGAWQAKLKPGSLAHKIYGSETISERHRHRYELNNEYKKILEDNGLIVSGTTTDGALAEFIEWRDSFGIATQAHPEFKSRPENPAPLFSAFVENALLKSGAASEGKYSYNLSASV